MGRLFKSLSPARVAGSFKRNWLQGFKNGEILLANSALGAMASVLIFEEVSSKSGISAEAWLLWSLLFLRNVFVIWLEEEFKGYRLGFLIFLSLMRR